MKVLIGVAWPYASGPRHLGHVAGAYLPADIVARYHRLAGDEVLMISGSDQHGTPITVAAEAAGEAPSVFADRQHAAIAASFERIGISFDHFTRTATPTHHRVVQEVFGHLYRRGLIYEATAESAWCPVEGRSLPDRYVEGICPVCAAPDARGDQCDVCGRTLDPEDLGSPRCRRCGSAATFRALRQLFLALDRLQPELSAYVEAASGSWRAFVAEETRGVLRQGLRARAITRDLNWGVPVPLAGWEERRLYVWFDAVVGYLSASREWAEEAAGPHAWREWWADPESLHRYFIGKDNLFFHTIFWPALLLGAGQGWKPPDEVVANHYLTLAGEQMSASRGHGFGLDEAIERLGVDPLRHALCARNPESADAEFSYEAAEEMTRTGLVGAIANPSHRVATLLWRRFGGRLDPAAWAAAGPHRLQAEALLAEAAAHLRAVELRRGLEVVHGIGRRVNRVLADTEPWKLPDSQAQEALAATVHYLDALAVAAWPIVPATAEAIRSTFGRPARPSAWALDPSPPVVGQEPEPPLRLTAAPAPAMTVPPRRAFAAATVRAAYDTVAEDYTNAFGHDLAALPLDRAMLEHLAERAGADGVVLDLGCGPAPAGGYLGELGTLAVGADLSTGMLRQARVRLSSIPVVQADMRRLPFRSAAFDGIVAYYCIQHVARAGLPAVVEEVGRVLGPAGAVLIAAHLGQGEVVIEDFLGHRVEPLGGTLYGRDELAAVLEAAGFYIEMEERRGPLAHEADTERIYLLGRRRS